MFVTPMEAFDCLDQQIRAILSPRKNKTERHPRSFGSAVATYTGPFGVFQFIWDGKEQHFVLQRKESPDASDWDGWSELIRQPFDPRIGDARWVDRFRVVVSEVLEPYRTD